MKAKVSGPHVVLTEKRARGRPAVAEPLYPASTRLPPDLYDKCAKMASAADTSVSQVLRQAVSVFVLNINVVRIDSRR